MKKSAKKTIEIVAGPNGSGKTTFAESYLLGLKRNASFLNPDLIASGLAPLDFERASFQAGHNIPRHAVIRRYSRCFENFWNLYRPLCSDWHLFDNSSAKPKRVLSKSEYEELDDQTRVSFEAGRQNNNQMKTASITGSTI